MQKSSTKFQRPEYETHQKGYMPWGALLVSIVTEPWLMRSEKKEKDYVLEIKIIVIK